MLNYALSVWKCTLEIGSIRFSARSLNRDIKTVVELSPNVSENER